MRAFIIGNGISLNNTPMDMLVDEISFGMNRIHLHYENTIWRPTYYVCVDYTGETYLDDAVIHTELGEHCFFTNRIAKELYNRVRYWHWPINITLLPTCTQHVGANHLSAHRPTKWHLPLFCKFGTGLSVSIQIAVSMGLNPLYVIGCDLGFVEPPRRGPDPNHFHPAYKTRDDFPINQRDDTLIYTHEIAKQECKKRDILVYNATVGGILEVYPRVDFINILEGKDE